MIINLFIEERHAEILNILNKEGKVVVKDLSIKFNVTEDCIRKDLKILENKGCLKRAYGGAIPFRKLAHIETIDSRKHAKLESKEIIAQKAFELIEDGETIFLDISTTNILLAKLLSNSHKKLTVITNMLDVMAILRNDENHIKVICPGGILCKDLNGFIGSMTIENISNYRLNKCFIGSCGVNLIDKSITSFDMEDGNTKKSILKNSQKKYMIMDNSKFYFDATFKFATLDDIDTIITDSLPNNDILTILDKTGTDIL